MSSMPIMAKKLALITCISAPEHVASARRSWLICSKAWHLYASLAQTHTATGHFDSSYTDHCACCGHHCTSRTLLKGYKVSAS